MRILKVLFIAKNAKITEMFFPREHLDTIIGLLEQTNHFYKIYDQGYISPLGMGYYQENVPHWLDKEETFK